MCSSHIIAVTIGFEETLVEVEESDQQATLNVRISFPTQLEIMFSLFANTMDGSASMDNALQLSEPFFIDYCIILCIPRIKTIFSYLA